MSPIDPRVQAALDGDVEPATLPADLREAYDRVRAAADMLAVAPVPGLSVEERVMAEIRRPAPVRTFGRRLVDWLAEPRAVTLSWRPVWTLAAAAALVAFVLIPGEGPAPIGAGEGVAQFVGHFPGARSVEVVGSFNDWRRGSLPLADDNGDGIWHGATVLPAGSHEYMFVVDGERWVADPLAGRYVEDGFGQKNSLLIIRPAGGPGL